MAPKKVLLGLVTLLNLFYITAASCQQKNFRAMSGRLQSPGFGTSASYGANLYCTYNIVVTQGYRVVLDIKTLSVLGTMPECSEDSLEVQVGCEKISIGKFCSCSELSIPNKIYSLDECMTLVFKTDASNSSLGFEANYKAVKNDTPVDSSHSANCSNTKQDNASGIIYSPRWPLDYAPDFSCSWLINPPEKKVVRMFFMSLELDEQDAGCAPQGSAFSSDEVRINGTNTNGSHVDIKQRICSDIDLDKMYFEVEKMKGIQVRFATSPDKEKSGFVIGYATYKKGVLGTPDSGCTEQRHTTDEPPVTTTKRSGTAVPLVMASGAFISALLASMFGLIW